MTEGIAITYRGYQLTSVEDAIDVSLNGEHIDWHPTLAGAKALVDYWVEQSSR